VSEYSAEWWRGAKVNLCGRLTPRETAAVLEGAEVFLGPDSGRCTWQPVLEFGA